ncbi:MAG: sigma-70 family RNA polymerase sigma factor [Lentisphaeraceae bacterium]|nr:sigma-70 family RNA polymerase sigma factor [Lentisphaeraceae bacterium]
MAKYSNTRETLLIKLRDQYDEPAWSEFHKIYKHFIFAILIKMNVPFEAQDDLVQEILLKAWKNLPKFEYQKNNGKFRNWLGLVVSNTARSYYRKQNNALKAIGKIESETEIEPEIQEISDKEWKLFISNKAWENVKVSLGESVIACFELISEGHDLKNVAEKSGIPYNTVCVYKKRIINKISREIVRLEQELG